MKRSPLKRKTRLRKRGARAEREAEALAEFRRAVLARARWVCERCSERAGFMPYTWLHAHHIKPRSRGGTHDPENGAALCGYCHMGVHSHTVKDWRSWIITRK